MDLHHSIAKGFTVAALFGLTLAAPDVERIAPAAPTSVSAEPVSVGPARGEPKSDAATEDAPAPREDVCGDGMILVEGEYCPEVEQVCQRWLDPPPYQRLRCAEYAKPAKCKSPRVQRRFCIDRDELAEVSPSGGAPLPVVNKNWREAQALCASRGARLCRETEWEFACEGPEMSPYPYGWKRDASICNFDRTDLGGPMGKLTDHRAPIGAHPDCKSPFGVRDMVGNVDEWVEREGASPPNRSALRGGWWLPGRNRCRAATTAHGEDYSGKQVGLRCCKDPAGAPEG